MASMWAVVWSPSNDRVIRRTGPRWIGRSDREVGELLRFAHVLWPYVSDAERHIGGVDRKGDVPGRPIVKGFDDQWLRADPDLILIS
jgi:hypothetical protein